MSLIIGMQPLYCAPKYSQNIRVKNGEGVSCKCYIFTEIMQAVCQVSLGIRSWSTKVKGQIIDTLQETVYNLDSYEQKKILGPRL